MRLLIDGIVRQATVLLAQVSTAFGVRAPLSHVADQVFYELAREIETHGVRRQVVADMFGMALRSYQKKMTRLGESASAPNRTLWEAVLGYVEAHQPTREQVVQRFRGDGERAVAAVLTDLVRTGLCFTTGEGDRARYGITHEDLRRAIERRADVDSAANIVWLKVFHNEMSTRAELRGLLPGDEPRIDLAIDELLQSGRLRLIDAGEEERFDAANVVIPRDEEQGFEAAALDHFRAVCATIGARLGGLDGRRPDPDLVGGSTFTFTITRDHPFGERVRAQLAEQRAQAQQLWDQVSAYNAAVPPGDDATRVTFYLGQHMVEEEGS